MPSIQTAVVVQQGPHHGPGPSPGRTHARPSLSPGPSSRRPDAQPPIPHSHQPLPRLTQPPTHHEHQLSHNHGPQAHGHSYRVQHHPEPFEGGMGMPPIPSQPLHGSTQHSDSPQRHTLSSYQATPFSAVSPPFHRHSSGPPAGQPQAHPGLLGPFPSAPELGSHASAEFCMGSAGPNKSRYRGVSYDKKKRKWRVQIKVANLGKSGVSVGYYDTEEAAARAYDRAAIGLLGRDNCSITTNFPLTHYDRDPVPHLIGKTRDEVKATLKTERAKAPRRRFSSRQRTSRYMGVGSSNRKNQWQARILVYGKVTHLGYYETEDDAARVYDRVSISLHGDAAQTNFPVEQYSGEMQQQFAGMGREELQRALGVKPMDKSSRFRGVSKKKGKWEAKVMVNRKWAYRELFDSESEAAHAYDRAVWELKPKEAKSYINFKDHAPAGDPSKPLVLKVLPQGRSESESDEALSSPTSSMSSLPQLQQADSGFAPIHGCMLTADDILGNCPSSLPDSLEPAHSPTALFLQQASQSMLPGHSVADEDHMLYAQPGPETPSSQAKRALFPGCSPAASTSLRKQGLGCAGDRDDQPPQDVQRGRHPSVIAKADAIYQRARECFEAVEDPPQGLASFHGTFAGSFHKYAEDAPAFHGSMPGIHRQAAPSRLSSAGLPPRSPFEPAALDQLYGPYQHHQGFHKRQWSSGESGGGAGLTSVPEGQEACHERPIHRSQTLLPTLEMRDEAQDESRDWLNLTQDVDMQMDPGEPTDIGRSFDVFAAGWPTDSQMVVDAHPGPAYGGVSGFDECEQDFFGHSQAQMDEGLPPGGLPRSQSAHQLPSPPPSDHWDSFRGDNRMRQGPGHLGRSVSLSQLPRPHPPVHFTFPGQPGLKADRETAIRACNLIVQQLGAHSLPEELQQQPPSPFRDLQIGGDPINVFSPSGDSEDELFHAYTHLP
ncbi:hypothetical protein WJX84_001715 [Apatococcus fuscideae]|uniref:AP2/ERF domain-containing protein n=1 Tax=Apatococcus fuscideae TaxID=2026836 RepID=A0AAW1TD01_9CHLO